MRIRSIVLTTVAVVAGTVPAAAQEAPVDSLALARQYTEWLYAGEADSLYAHTAEASREQMTAERYAQVSSTIADRAGFEVDAEETWKLRNGDCQYWRTATVSNMDEDFLLVRWVLTPEGRIEGLGVGPYSQAPPVDAETCGPPESD